MTDNRISYCLISFVAGAAACLLTNKVWTKKDRSAAGATIEGNDLSLFYGDVSELTTIKESCRYLESSVYGKLVLNCVICCVDVVVVRRNAATGKKECVLVERSTEPVKGYWWWPGGRLLKGETIFAAAKRKAQQETGLNNVKPIQILGFWNTLFPTSAWDNETDKGTQTVNAIVLVELDDKGADVVLDETSERWRWIGLDPQKARENGEDKYVIEALERLYDWDPSYHSSM